MWAAGFTHATCGSVASGQLKALYPHRSAGSARIEGGSEG